VFLNPLISWLWIGVLIVVLGTAFALVPNAMPKRRESTANADAPAVVEVAHV
jgi:cytochrome c-type biogenesis protein CcmF